jgi:hypothetical protein
MQILVLGMHRSGTSMLARLLNPSHGRQSLLAEPMADTVGLSIAVI